MLFSWNQRGYFLLFDSGFWGRRLWPYKFTEVVWWRARYPWPDGLLCLRVFVLLWGLIWLTYILLDCLLLYQEKIFQFLLPCLIDLRQRHIRLGLGFLVIIHLCARCRAWPEFLVFCLNCNPTFLNNPWKYPEKSYSTAHANHLITTSSEVSRFFPFKKSRHHSFGSTRSWKWCFRPLQYCGYATTCSVSPRWKTSDGYSPRWCPKMCKNRRYWWWQIL